jgi:hypothetical protein
MKTITFLLASLILLLASCRQPDPKPRVFIFTDINIDAGDPDDRQSLVHLLWYGDEVDIAGIVPDRWDARGFEACQMAVEAYEIDFDTYNFKKLGYPDPGYINDIIARDINEAGDLFVKAASAAKDPLYVLVWGNMSVFNRVLRQAPELAENIRVVSIGTGLMYEDDIKYLPENWTKSEPCVQLNWNGHGRNEIYNDPVFNNMWWVEINWTYNGMFSGNEPREMYEKLSGYGALGQHMIDVTKNEPWARYFRVGDTPSVLYVIDPDNDLDDPTQGSWAGKFARPFPETRPNYYTDDNGSIEWDYSNPCNTWENHRLIFEHARGTLEKERPSMYEALLNKLNSVYGMTGR